MTRTSSPRFGVLELESDLVGGDFGLCWKVASSGAGGAGGAPAREARPARGEKVQRRR